MKIRSILLYVAVFTVAVNFSASSADSASDINKKSQEIKSDYDKIKQMIESNSLPSGNTVELQSLNGQPVDQKSSAFDNTSEAIKSQYKNYSSGTSNVSKNSNSLFSPCLSSYLQGMAGGNNPGGCNVCYKKGLASKSQLAGVIDPTINSVIVDPNSDTVNPAAWNSLTPIQKEIILTQNPKLSKAIENNNSETSINCNL